MSMRKVENLDAPFAARLRVLMQEKRATCRKLGTELYISPTSIGYYRRGKAEPNIETIQRLCRYFNVSSDWLLGISDERRSL